MTRTQAAVVSKKVQGCTGLRGCDNKDICSSESIDGEKQAEHLEKPKLTEKRFVLRSVNRSVVMTHTVRDT